MTLYLVLNPESPYYQSTAFDKLLDFAKNHPKICRLSERNHRRLMSILEVETVEKAVGIVGEIGG
jgi:transcription-repair coupling factor (superfamily II helicase)